MAVHLDTRAPRSPSRRRFLSLFSANALAAQPEQWSPQEERAHVLRRLTMTPHPGVVENLEDLPARQLGLQLIDEAYGTTPGAASAADLTEPEQFAAWWVARLADPGATLRDRMTWFWHNHMPSSFENTEVVHIVEQHGLLSRLALGNFRDLLQAITIDAAMLQFLDGSYSRGDAPNENYAREAMELFALGVGNYSEDDVRVAARGLSGWFVDWDDSSVGFDPEWHYDRPLRFFGTRKTWTNESIVDAICDQPSCARHVASRLHSHLVGSPPSSERLDSLATTFRDADLELRPLLEAIVDHDEFVFSVRTRARSAVEFVVGAQAALGTDSLELQPWSLWDLGQMPYYPPNVAGWPGDQRWLTSAQAMSRSELIFQAELSDRIISRVEPTVEAVLAHCGLFDVSEQTRRAMADAAAEFPYDHTLELLMSIALASPEFQLA